MSKEFLNDDYNLPPNVNGKLRGYLEIEISELIWCAAAFNGAWKLARGSRKLKTADNFIGSGGISIKFIWWGQSLQDGAVIKVPGYSGKLEKQVFRYGIHTTPKLFRNYLSNCEPIEIKLTANTSNLQLGTVFARVPVEILSGCKLDGGREVVHVGKFRIFSPKNVHLGSIELKFKMLFYENLISSARSSEYSWKSLQSKDILGSDLLLNGLKTTRSYKNFKNGNLSTGIRSQSKSALSPKILDYLSGRDMSPMEEENALEEIRSTSPLNSFVDQFLTDRIKTRQEDLYGRLDSLRLTVKSLTLLSAGIREVYVQSLASVNFTIECRISPNLLDNVRRKCDYDIMRFYSDTYSDKSQKINFNKDAIRAVRIVRNEFDPSIVEQAYLLFTIWWRQFGSKNSRCLGTTKFDFTSLFETPELEQIRRLPVISCAGNIYVADLVCKVTLGTKGVHFGPDFITSFKDETSPEVSSTCSAVIQSIPTYNKRKIRKRNNDKDDIETNENTSNSNNESSSKSSIITERSNQATQTVGSITPRKMQENGNFVDTMKPWESDQYKLLQGLLYVGALRNVKPIEGGGYFLVCRAFWKEDATSTEFAQENSFNFLEIFPIINDQKFLDRVRNNHLNLELWQKTTNSPEQMIGVVRLPLHQFFIAFRDSTITNHLCQAKLPVISIDGWVSITSPLSGEICGQLQSLLAIGTEEQLEYLKASRGLNFNYVCLNPIPDFNGVQIPVPQIPKLYPPNHSESDRPVSCDVEIQTNLNESISARRERLSDLLGTFIENLAQRLPTERHIKENSMSEESNCGADTPQNHPQGIQIRKTSDLLDVLQKALVTPPTYNISARRSNSDSAIITAVPQHPSVPQKICKILLEIESALHLPRNHLKLCNKKCSKRASGNKMKQSRLPPDEEPSAYVTFQAEEGYGQMIKSHEGLVYATNVVEKNCCPSWLKRFEVAVPADLLTNDEKRFILKVWRKATTDLAQCRLLPTPMEDSIIGFAAIDLNVLLARMPCISGWFNIVDFNGRVNGQIKVNVQPLEDVMKFKETTFLKSSPTTASQVPSDLEIVGPVADLNNTTLSRAIKRKFTELEEITQRLRARLFDVTGEVANEEAANLGGVDDAQLDEFERDISTPAEEDDEDEDVDGRQNFGWLGCVPSNIDAIHSECSSASGGDSQERIQMISEYLRRTDINEPQQRQEIYRNVEEECKLPDGGGTEGSRCTTND